MFGELFAGIIMTPVVLIGKPLVQIAQAIAEEGAEFVETVKETVEDILND